MEQESSKTAEYSESQLRTFTRWCNVHLLKCDIQLVNTVRELVDGTVLINLSSVLTQKPAPKYNRKPVHKIQKIENLTIALNTFQNAGVKLVNIGAEDIYGESLKLDLGLIWSLIIHFQMSQFREQEHGNDKTVRDALGDYIKRLLKLDNPPDNFSGSWNDGILLSRIVNTLAPNTLREWATMKPENAVENCSKGLSAAEKYLGVPQLILPEELANPNIDEKSVMTYVSTLVSAKPIVELPTMYTNYQIDMKRSKIIHASSSNPYIFLFSFDPLTKDEPDIEVTLTSTSSGQVTKLPHEKIIGNLYKATLDSRLAGTFTLNVSLYRIPNQVTIKLSEKPDDDILFACLSKSNKSYSERVNKYLVDLRGSGYTFKGLRIEGKHDAKCHLQSFSKDQIIVSVYFPHTGEYSFITNAESASGSINKKFVVDVVKYPFPENTVVFGLNPLVSNSFNHLCSFEVPFITETECVKCLNPEDFYSVDFKVTDYRGRESKSPAIKINENGEYSANFLFYQNDLHICIPSVTSAEQYPIKLAPAVFYVEDVKTLTSKSPNNLAFPLQATKDVTIDIILPDQKTEILKETVDILEKDSETWAIANFTPHTDGVYRVNVQTKCRSDEYLARSESPLTNYKICNLGALKRGITTTQNCTVTFILPKETKIQIDSEAKTPLRVELVDQNNQVSTIYGKPILSNVANVVVSAPKAGKYKVNFYFRDALLPESGIEMECLNKSDFTVSSYASETSYSCGKLYNFTYSVPNEPGSTIELSLIGQKRNISKLIKVSDECYALSLVCRSVGQNNLYIKNNNITASNCPFKYDFVEESTPETIFGKDYITENECMISIPIVLTDASTELNFPYVERPDGSNLRVSCETPDGQVVDVTSYIKSQDNNSIELVYTPLLSGVNVFRASVVEGSNVLDLAPHVVYVKNVPSATLQTKTYFYVLKKSGKDIFYIEKKSGRDHSCELTLEEIALDGVACYKITCEIKAEEEHFLVQEYLENNVSKSKKFKLSVINPVKEEPDLSRLIVNGLADFKNHALTYGRTYTVSVDASFVAKHSVCGDSINCGITNHQGQVTRSFPVKYIGNEKYEINFKMECSADNELTIFWKSNYDNSCSVKLNGSPTPANDVRFLKLKDGKFEEKENIQIIVDARYTSNDIKSIEVKEPEEVSFLNTEVSPRVYALTLWNASPKKHLVEVVLDNNQVFSYEVDIKPKDSKYDNSAILGLNPIVGCDWTFTYPFQILELHEDYYELESISYEKSAVYSSSLYNFRSDNQVTVPVQEIKSENMTTKFQLEVEGSHVLSFQTLKENGETMYCSFPVPIHVFAPPQVSYSEDKIFEIYMEDGDTVILKHKDRNISKELSKSSDLIKTGENRYQYKLTPEYDGEYRVEIKKSSGVMYEIPIVVIKEILECQFKDKIEITGFSHLNDIPLTPDSQLSVLVNVKNIPDLATLAREGSVTGVLRQADGTETTIEFTFDGSTIYETTLKSLEVGKYHLDVYFNNELVLVKEFAVALSKEPFITRLTDGNLECEHGIPIVFPIAHSTFSQVNADVRFKDGTLSGEVLIIPITGCYSIVAVLTYEAGDHVLSFYQEGQTNSFQALNIRDNGVSTEKNVNEIELGVYPVAYGRVKLTQNALMFTDENKDCFFVADFPKDSNLNASFIYPEEALKTAVEIKKKSSDSYKIKFTPAHPGLNVIIVEAEYGKHTRRYYPLVLNVREQPALNAGEKYTFKMVSNNSVKSSARILSETDDNYVIDEPLVIWEDQGSAKELRFPHFPKKEGRYLAEIKLGEKVLKYGFTVDGNVEEIIDVTTSTVVQDDIYDQDVPAGVPVFIPKPDILQKPVDLKCLKVQVLLLDEYDQVLKKSIFDVLAVHKSYVEAAIPDEAGKYYVALLLNNIQITSYYKVTTSYTVKSSLRIKITEQRECVCFSPITAIVDARLYKSKISSFKLSGAKVMHTKFIEIEANIYMITFVVEEEGNYDLIVKFDSNESSKVVIKVSAEPEHKQKYFINDNVSLNLELGIINLKENEQLINKVKLSEDAQCTCVMEYLTKSSDSQESAASSDIDSTNGVDVGCVKIDSENLRVDFIAKQSGLVFIYPAVNLSDGTVKVFLPKVIYVRQAMFQVGQESLFTFKVGSLEDFTIKIAKADGTIEHITNYDIFVRDEFIMIQFYYVPTVEGEGIIQIYQKNDLLISETVTFKGKKSFEVQFTSGMECEVGFTVKPFSFKDDFSSIICDEQNRKLSAQVFTTPDEGKVRVQFRPLMAGKHQVKLVKNENILDSETSEITLISQEALTTSKITYENVSKEVEKEVKYKIRYLNKSNTEPISWIKKDDTTGATVYPCFKTTSTGPFEVVKIKKDETLLANKCISLNNK